MIFQIFFIGEIFHINECFHLIIWRDLYHVLDRTAFRGFSSFRNFIASQPEASSLLRKEQKIVVRARHEYMLEKIFFTGRASFCAHPSPSLPSIRGQVCAFDITEMRNGK